MSIGHEILIDPAILLLDEPTSGLDSTTALRIVQVLQKLAHVRTLIAPYIIHPYRIWEGNVEEFFQDSLSLSA